MELWRLIGKSIIVRAFNTNGMHINFTLKQRIEVGLLLYTRATSFVIVMLKLVFDTNSEEIV